MKALHFLASNSNVRPEFLEAVRHFPGIELELHKDWASLSPEQLAQVIRGSDILILSRAPRMPDELAQNPGHLKYICYLHGTMNRVIGLPIIRSSIKVTNWGNAMELGLAESSMTLLLAVFKDLPRRIMAVRAGNGRGIRNMGTHIAGLNVGIYGFGFAGRAFAKLLQPFDAVIRVFDPYAAGFPDYCKRVHSLQELFTASQAIVIHAGLTPETQHSVSRELLSLLPDQGIVINTARGAIIDQTALFDALKAGRLRAGLDVLWPDDLPPHHEARQWENLIWTCHQLTGEPWPSEGVDGILKQYRNHLDNIRAFAENKPLQFVIDEVRYSRMT